MDAKMKKFAVEIEGTVRIRKYLEVDALDEQDAEDQVDMMLDTLQFDEDDVEWHTFEYVDNDITELKKPIDPNQLVMFPEARFD